MAPGTDRTTRISSAVASPVATNHAAKGSVLVNLTSTGNLKIASPEQHRKDKHGQRGLVQMVADRKNNLKYLKRESQVFTVLPAERESSYLTTYWSESTTSTR